MGFDCVWAGYIGDYVTSCQRLVNCFRYRNLWHRSG